MKRFAGTPAILLCLVCLLGAVGGAHAQDAVTNGDFEGTWTSGDTWIANGWTEWDVPLPPTQYSQSGYAAVWEMPGNNGVADATNNFQRVIGGSIRSSNVRGGVVQAVAVTPALSYDIDFDAAYVSDVGNAAVPRYGQFGYDLTGQTADGAASTINWTGLVDMDSWSHYSLRVLAENPSISLWFKIEIPEATSTLILDMDNVSVIPAAEPLITIVDGPTVTQIDSTTFQVTWSTNIASTSVVQYDTTAPGKGDDEGVIAYASQATQAGLWTVHTVTLTGLTIEQFYHYRVVSSASGYKTVYSPDAMFQTPPPPESTLLNGDFETVDNSSGVNVGAAWRPFGTVGDGSGFNRDGIIGAYPSDGTGAKWYFNAIAAGGSYFGGSAASYGMKNGGFYQRISAIAGKAYTLNGKIFTIAFSSSGQSSKWDNQVAVGIDPNGGIDPNAPGIVWNDEAERWSSAYPPYPPPWSPTTVTAVAAADAITIFVRFQMNFAWNFNIVGVDDLALDLPLYTASSVGDARTQANGTNIDFATGVEQVVTLVPISDTGFFYMQDPDGSSGIRVETAGTLPALGDNVTVSGKIDSLPSGERAIRSATVTVTSGAATTPIRKTINREIGGKGYVDQSGSSQTYGLTTQGLLMKISGRVTKVDYANDYFLMDDGSEVESLDSAPGIKVIRTGLLPLEGQYVTVIGVVSAEDAGGRMIRVLRGREDFSELIIEE